jgi:hypothetical protein
MNRPSMDNGQMRNHMAKDFLSIKTESRLKLIEKMGKTWTRC